MVRLTRLRIDRFRSVEPGTELRFGATFNVLLGKNATGKTTLLDLVAAVTNDDLSAYASEDAGFDLSWWLESGDDQLEFRAARTPAPSGGLGEYLRGDKEFDDVFAAVVRTNHVELGRLEVIGTRGTWMPVGGVEDAFEVRAGLAAGRSGMRALLEVADKYSFESPEFFRLRAAIAMLAFHGRVERFDEALNAFTSITHATFELTREGKSTGASFGSWLPVDFLRAAELPTSSDALVVPFAGLSSLADVPALLGFAAAELHPRVLQRSQAGEKVTTSYQGLDCLFQRRDGSQVSHDLLSFGQKRLFAFLWYLAARADRPVVADELLNGLHHEWIEACFERLRERQSFLATQHPLLLDHVPIESAAAVRTTFIRCTTQAAPTGREQIAWRNFDEEEAERFFVAHQTGIQHVSEVLRSEGLW